MGKITEIYEPDIPRDEHGLPYWMNGEHPIWKTCMICGCFCDPAVYKDFTCPRCREPEQVDMECNECGGKFMRKDMFNDFLCKECAYKAMEA